MSSRRTIYFTDTRRDEQMAELKAKGWQGVRAVKCNGGWHVRACDDEGIIVWCLDDESLSEEYSE